MARPHCLHLRLIVAGLLVLIVAPLVLADFIFLKDGTTLKGKVQIEGTTLHDPESGRDFWIKKLGGFYLIDDGARRMVFSSRQVAEARANPTEAKYDPETITFKPILLRSDNSPALRSIQLEAQTPWRPNAERTLTLRNEKGDTRDFDQCIVTLTPQYFRASGRRCRWNASYLTSELEPAMAISLMRTQLAKQTPPIPKLEQQLRVYRFCQQAGWYDEAQTELDAILKSNPTDRERLEDQGQILRRLRDLKVVSRAEQMLAAGQFKQLATFLAAFRDEGAAEAPRNRVRALREELAKRNAALQTARHLFETVRREASDAKALQQFTPLLTEIEQGLNPDTYQRLEPFVTLARQEEKNRFQGVKAQLTPEQLLALAVTGWQLGHTAAESDVKSATRLCQARQFLLEYLRNGDANERAQLLGEYQRGESLRYDVIMQLLSLLPPPVSKAEVPGEPTDLTVDDAARGEKLVYRIQLPPEYHHHRAYPLLIALPNTREEPEVMLGRWSTQAAEHGYILAVPRWADRLQEFYQFTEKEQDVVTTVMRDVRRRFNVDSERIFLAGFDQSGTMAYDVGMAHPDLFAGVAVMCGVPGKVMTHYKYNTQYLPFYVVDGEKSPHNRGDNRSLFEYWVSRGFPSLYVEYNGRGLEFFPAEVPAIFDWMSRKKRAQGLPDLGGPDPLSGSLGQEFRSTREGDNRFYWVSSERLSVGSTAPASVAGRVSPATNGITIRTSGFRQLTVWLNTAMLDLEQPVEIRVNPGSSGKIFKGKLQPGLRTLLEDFYSRGDKKNLFVARVDFNL